ncbi:GumC family protein [Rhizobium sp. CNPSo 4039]|uniref:GumC family protein n=1 Tax=Rhizobium sp. CNPSo 4039 TaxID=3021409 RepID=UPI0025516389|nr:GumC family protein [Rhizobium sp. CNPSo 4039]MDK4715550.1 GumC family protein [Rhizobium sp. CNPSo 4039]
MKPFNIDERSLPPLFDVGAVWTILWQRWLTVLTCTIAVLLLALAYLVVAKPSYTATASVMIDPRDPRATNLNNVLPGIGSDSAAIASQVFVIESRDLLMKVFESENIESDPEFANGGLLSRIGLASHPTKDSIFKNFQRAVTVERAGLTYVIDVSFASRYSDKAARIANAIVNRYKAGLSGERETANSDVNSLLASRIGNLQKNVSDAEQEVGDFKVSHQILDASAGGTLQSQIDKLTDQLIGARSEADRAKDKYAQAVAAGTSPAGLAKLSEILSSEATVKLRENYNQRAADLANYEAMYQPRHPMIKRLRSELDRMQGLMAVEAQRITRELKAKSDLAVQNVAALQAKLDDLRQRLESSDAAQVQLRQLEAKTKAARTVLDDFLKRAEETSQMQGLQLQEARVISAAAPPVQPTWPKPLLLLPVSAALGLIIGCGLALVRGPRHQPEQDPTSPFRRSLLDVEPHKDPSPEIAKAEPAPVHLGEYRLPGVAGVGAYLSIRAMRRRFFQAGNEAFSRDVLQLMRRIILHLREHPKPYVLLVSSLHTPLAARLAGAMVGLGLQQAEQNVLVVEFGDLPGLGAPARSGNGVFISGASGLRTVVYNRPVTENSEPSARLGLDDILITAGSFDFVLLMGPSIVDGNWDPALFADADLMLFALSPAEEAAEIANMLRQRVDADQIARSATLTIAPEHVDTRRSQMVRPIRSADDGGQGDRISARG